MRTSRLVAMGSALMLLASCAKAPDRTSLGARRVALDLAYADEDLRVPPQVLVRVLPALPEDLAIAFPGVPTLPKPPAIPNPLACPKAPADAVPEEPATVAFKILPVEGTYLVRNVGTIKLTGPVPISVPYPPLSKLVVKDVSFKDGRDPVYASVRTTTYTVVEEVLPTYTIASTYSYTTTGLTPSLNLVKRVTTIDGNQTVFEPTPAVQMYAFEGQGTAWNSAGIDLDTTQSLVVRGTMLPPEAVDICGTLIDAQRTQRDEVEVDLDDVVQSGSRPGSPTIVHWAMQFGGLPIRTEIHGSQVIQTDTTPVIVETDVVSTLMSVNPVTL